MGKKEAGGKAAQGKAPLIRDSFTFPEEDYALIAQLRARLLDAGRDVKKSEILRGGLAVLAALPVEDLLNALDGVRRIKTGRPHKSGTP
ncbi:hypothetical protein [Zoogloea sp.]|uniref:hypothetical protein n=1 Tax=Zoogloea sp. TaxID=49181 RepID=UPI00261CE7A3|nr:hypothetical protein [Zoogloea sp.]MDD3353265.1 hypothetical protein [Zoogloea sp.]